MPDYIKIPLSELAKFTPVPKEPAPKPPEEHRDFTPLDTARTIMGERFFGSEALKTSFGIDIPETDLPPIPFTEQELAEANARGEYLIYRPDIMPDGKPLTMQTIAERVQPALTQNSQGKALYKVDWYAAEPFYTTETPRKGWALVSREPIPNTTSKDYIEQTQTAIDRLATVTFATQPLPPEYQKAIAEFHQYIQTTFPGKTPEEIHAELGGANWKQYAEQLANLSITTLTRHTAPEVFFDTMLLRAATQKDTLLPALYTWTSSRSSDGGLVSVGHAGADGARVDGWDPGSRDGGLGVLLSRRGSGS